MGDINISGHAPVAHQSVVNKQSGNVVSEEDAGMQLAPEQIEGTPATVRVGLSFTKNLGDFHSCKYTVGLDMPSGTSNAEINDTFKRAHDWVDARLTGLLQAAAEELAGS